jgi:hypothetical protein
VDPAHGRARRSGWVAVPVQASFGYAWAVSERAQVAERAAVAYLALADLAETIEDEWQYVTDLVDAYLPSIRAMSVGPTAAVAQAPEAEAAVDEAIAEIALITDPHKAIDWLSTFPHVAALALGCDGDEPANDEPIVGAEGGLEPSADEDSPFRILRGDR